MDRVDEHTRLVLDRTRLPAFEGLWVCRLAQVWEVSEGPQLFI